MIAKRSTGDDVAHQEALSAPIFAHSWPTLRPWAAGRSVLPPKRRMRSRTRCLSSFRNGTLCGLLVHRRNFLLAQEAHRPQAVSVSLPRCSPTCASRF